MRNTYTLALRRFFHEKLLRHRQTLGISQEEVAYRLGVSSRSYADLEHGKNCCSGVTLALYLAYSCEDPEKFLEDLRNIFDDCRSSDG